MRGLEGSIRLPRWRPVTWCWPLALVVVAALILDPSDAFARVGGGESFGAPSSPGGGGGGDDGALLLLLWYIARLLIWVTIEYPAIGIPLDILFVVVVVLIFRHRARRRGAGRRARPTRRTARATAAQRNAAVAAGLHRLRDEDPSFSQPLMLDFVQLLYVRAHEHRGSGKLANLAPYLSRAVRKQLGQQASLGQLSGVREIVIGSSRIVEVGGWGGAHRTVAVEFEANYTERLAGDGKGAETILFAHERWLFRRRAGVLSRAPDAIRELRCPSCGAAVELRPDGTCPYCENVVDRGDFHWTVSAVHVLARRPRTRVEGRLGGGVEIGTDLRTVIHPGLASELRALKLRDPGFDLQAFKAQVTHVFMELQRAWSDLSWDRARAFETDHLHALHGFWIEQFRRDRLRVVLEKIRVGRMELAKVEQDAFHDAITVRVFASMIDYTEGPDGGLVSGSRSKPRSFSEYWTFIRRAGCRSEEAGEPDSCPSCGAGLKVSQAGVCEYCETKVVTGEFGWVLSVIEQDEVYGG